MNKVTLLHHLQRDSAVVAASARALDALSEPVPGCPGMSAGDVVHHLGSVHHWCADNVRKRPAEGSFRSQVASPSRPPDHELATWFEQGAATLHAVLGEAEPDEACWTWWRPDQTAGFWHRRMAHETCVHRWDVEAAQGSPHPIDSDLAADGVDEYLRVFAVVSRAIRKPAASGETFHFHRTDGEGEWLVRLLPKGATEVSAEHAKGDVALRGPAVELYLWLWGRLPLFDLDTTEAFGDTALLDRWAELVPAM